MNPRRCGFSLSSILPVSAVLLLGFLLALQSYAVNLNSSVVVGNAIPQISNIKIDNNADITLTSNATKTVQVSFTVTDNNGCADVFTNGSLQTILYREGVSSTCTESQENCYFASTPSITSCTGTSTTGYATSSFDLWYFADATDASSSFSSEKWYAYVLATDQSNTTSSATSTGVEVNTLTALQSGTSSINYGQVSANANTGATNQITEIQNAGNSSTSLNINSQSTLTSGANKIATSSQHYASSSFTYGGTEQLLQDTAQLVSGFSIKQGYLGGEWVQNTAMLTNRRWYSLSTKNNFIYLIGGFIPWTGATSTVSYASVGEFGITSAWQTTTALPAETQEMAAVTFKDYIYVIGGGTWSLDSTTTVSYARINATGSIGQWQLTSSLPYRTHLHTSIAYNDYLYKFGGSESGGGSGTSSILYARINSNGSLDSWQPGGSMPYAAHFHTSVVANGHVYIIGGYDINDQSTATVMFAKLNATGSIGSWVNTTPLPSTLKAPSSFVQNGNIYIVGGEGPDGATSTVLYAEINSDNTLGAWQSAAAMPRIITNNAAINNSGYLYVMPGYVNDTEDTSTVISTRLGSKKMYWGLGVPGGTPTGTYTGVNTFTGLFSP